MDKEVTRRRGGAEVDGSHGADLLAAFDAALDVRPHLAIEIGYTRCTDWMVHIWDVTGVGMVGAPKIISTQSPARKEAMSKAAAKLREMFGAVKAEGEAGSDARRTETVRPTQYGWRDPAVEMPDDEVMVLIRRTSEAYPVGIGTHQDGVWYAEDEFEALHSSSVTGWMHLHEAAAILDAAEGGEA